MLDCQALVKFVWDIFLDFATYSYAALLIYTATWGLFSDDALPGTPIFSVFMLMVLSYTGRKLANLVGLPGIFGCLVSGILFRNYIFPTYYTIIPMFWSTSIRNAALVIILLRTGLTIDKNILYMWPYICVCAGVPLLVELSSAVILSHALFDFDVIYCFILGFLVCGISPAVVVPCMVRLKQNNYGSIELQRIITAAAALNNLVAVTAIGVCVGITITADDISMTLNKIPLEIIMGTLFGSLIGWICWCLPPKSYSETKQTFYRFLILNFGGLAMNFVSISLDSAEAGAISCLALSVVADYRWRQNNLPDHNRIVAYETRLWNFIYVYLFGSMGAELTVEALQKDYGNGLILLTVGIILRKITEILTLRHTKYNWKEKLFMCLAWLPKATVQASMGQLAVYYAINLNLGADNIHYGNQIVTVAVLAILLTSPLGVLGIELLGPYLLTKSEEGPRLTRGSSMTTALERFWQINPHSKSIYSHVLLTDLPIFPYIMKEPKRRSITASKTEDQFPPPDRKRTVRICSYHSDDEPQPKISKFSSRANEREEMPLYKKMNICKNYPLVSTSKPNRNQKNKLVYNFLMNRK